jgi:predicted nucleic acid-binding protein
MRVKAARGEIDQAQARRVVAAVSAGGEPELRPSAPLAVRAFHLAERLDHPIYDCVYLALAEALDTALVTADGRFATAVGTTLPGRVELLGG